MICKRVRLQQGEQNKSVVKMFNLRNGFIAVLLLGVYTHSNELPRPWKSQQVQESYLYVVWWYKDSSYSHTYLELSSMFCGLA